jgi:hypothetical protein
MLTEGTNATTASSLEIMALPMSVVHCMYTCTPSLGSKALVRSQSGEIEMNSALWFANRLSL